MSVGLEPSRTAPPTAPVTSVIEVGGGLDLTTVPRLRELLRGAQGPGVRLVLDLSGVTHCDALALGVLVATARRARGHGGELRVLAPSPAVSRALGAAGLRRRLPVFAEDGAAAVPGARRPAGRGFGAVSGQAAEAARYFSSGGGGDERPAMTSRATSDSRRLCERA
ncbi:STAS domain-containing protein [Streptomyces varsoviensis]|uniref:STAS domain-containing protein n=1 Tax=Streptomyces varsoviensis TaxID=67373 RepID=UPI0033DCE1BE